MGKFELLRHLATGGMAEIWLARAKGIEGFEKLVVVKKLLPRIEQDPTLVSMFLDEARVAATLHHPNVVQVYDIGVADENDYFFSMEFVYGQDLSHLLRRAAAAHKPLSLDIALTIILGLCAGLHYAHEREGADGKPLRLVHRDVSPQNVLISYDGAVKIMDFGIAKATTSSQVTRDGTLKGKIAYMSPEQGVSGALDRRSDLFSLATLLWELTTFRRLFKADSDFESLRRIIQEDAPRPSRFRPDYPPELERIVMKGLRRNKEERYQTVEEMQLDLEAFARDRKLVISSVSLSRYIRDLFSDRVGAWTQAQALGKSFAEFLVETPSLHEGTSVTADTWIAPATEPTSTKASIAELDLLIEVLPGTPPPKRRRWPLVIAAASVLAVGGVLAWQLRGGNEPPPAHPTPAAVPAPAASVTLPASAPAVTPAPATAPATPEPAATIPDPGATVAKPAPPATKRPPPPATPPVVRKKPGDPATKTKPKPKEDLDSPFPD